uniref:AF4/FMR2 family member lilli n=1 Tax=Dracunculus medinensis TaxID=318479 RepID=A0A0N4UQ14_DRAME
LANSFSSNSRDKKEIEGDWQKPCSSGVDNKQEISEDISITINDLFGEDRKRKRTSKESSRNSEEATKMQNKNKEWTKADGESPDSGVQVDETTDSDREQNQISTANLIKEITLISPLLSPPRQPSTHLPHLTYKDGLPSLTCILDLSPLEPMQRSLYMEKIRLNTVAPPRPPLSPPSRPSFNGHISSPKISDMNKSPKITKGFKINGSSLPKNNKDKSKSKPGIKRKDISDAKQKNMEISKRTESPPLIQKVIIKKEPVVRIITPITNYKDSEKNGKIINILKDIKDERSGSSVSNHKESEKDKGKELKLVNEQLSSATNEKSEQKDKLKAKDYCKAKEKDANKRDNDKQKQGNLPISKTVNDLSDSVVNSNSLKEKDGKRNEKLKESNQMRESSIADKSYNYNVIKEMKEKEKSRNKDEISKENRKDLSVTDKNDSLRKNRQNHESDSCCAQRTAPAMKFAFIKNEDGSFKSPTFYQSDVARPLKHQADKEANEDKVKRTILYLESVAYFILSIAVKNLKSYKDTSILSQQYNSLRETAELLKTSTNRFTQIANHPPAVLHFVSRVKLLSNRTQAVLNYHLFYLRSQQAIKNYGILANFEPRSLELEKAAIKGENISNGSQSSRSAATPSPASSTHSVGSERQKEITVPLNVYQTQRSQLKILHHLLWAYRIWSETDASMSKLEKDMVTHLDELCGRLMIESDLFILSEYLATGASWLSAEYEMEKLFLEKN